MKGVGDGSVATAKPVVVTRGEQQQQPQEPSAKRTIVRPTKTTKEDGTLADRDAHSAKSAVASGKVTHTHLPAGRSPRTQHKDGDNRAERVGSGGPELKPGAAVAAAGHTSKTQVSEAAPNFLYLPLKEEAYQRDSSGSDGAEEGEWICWTKDDGGEAGRQEEKKKAAETVYG